MLVPLSGVDLEDSVIYTSFDDAVAEMKRRLFDTLCHTKLQAIEYKPTTIYPNRLKLHAFYTLDEEGNIKKDLY